MSQPEVIVHATADLLAATTAARLFTTLVDIQATGRIPAVALTGGGVGTKVLVDLNNSSARDAVDWSRVEIFWGDERFVPADDPDRNEKQAREALLDHIPVDPARVHAMAPSDGEFGDDVDAAAAAYGRPDRERGTGLDLVMLGMGDEGHVASIFPESPAVYDTRPVGRGAGLPQAAADPDVADPADDPPGDRGLDHHGGRQQGGRGRRRAGRGAGGGRARGRGGRPITHAVVAGPAIGLRAAGRRIGWVETGPAQS